MIWESFTPLQKIGLFLFGLLIATLVWSYFILKIIDLAERAWKMGDRKRKYLVICIVFFLFGLRMLDRVFK